MAHIPDDLLLAIVARRLDLVSPEALKRAVEKWAADPTRTLDAILGEMDLLAEEVRRALAELIKSLRDRVGESLLSEVLALDSSRQAATPQPTNEGTWTTDTGEADDTIDPFVPRSTVPQETGSPIPDPYGSTADAAPSSDEHYLEGEQDNASICWPGGTDAASRETLPPICLSAEQRYRLIRPMARGGLGQILLARDENFGREVALKQILTDFGGDGRMQERFLLEARITANLEHPGIVGVYAIGHDPGGRPFYVMRLIRGETLRDAIRRYHSSERPSQSAGARARALRKLINRLIAACNAVAFAHSRGVLHRDIKPANIMIGKFGETLVVDWGLARQVDKFVASADRSQLDLDHTDSTTMVEAGMVVGTPAYMSPEQAEGRQDLMEPTSDIYSLGATLYEILTGETPFRGKHVAEILLAVRKGQFRPPTHLNPAIDPALEGICLMAMAHAPEDRYATARAMADELERWLADEPVSAYREPVTKALSRWLSRHPHVLIRGLIALAAFLFLALSGIILPRLWQ
jgi:serine/threonine protein kinase